jgi:hypothetical protein
VIFIVPYGFWVDNGVEVMSGAGFVLCNAADACVKLAADGRSG